MKKKTSQSRPVSETYADYPLTRDGIEYAEQIVNGEIVAGQWIKLAAQRQLKDLSRKRFKYYFEPEESERVLSVLQLFPHVKGTLSGQPIKLEPWQCFVVGTVYGWLDKKTFFRRFHEVYLCVARKNGKSLIGAGLGLYHLALDNEPGPEVFAGNITEVEADKVWKPAQQMAKKSVDFRKECGVDVLANSIVTPGDNGKFAKLIGNPPDGDNPSTALIDEYHQHKSDHMYETMKTGMGSRPNWIIWLMTTAGNTIGGACHTYQNEMQQILSGAVVDEEKAAFIYAADDKDDWTDPATLRKANPNIGVSVTEEFLINRQREAGDSPRQQNGFRSKHLNQWVASRSVYLNMVDWRKCQNSKLNESDFEGRKCLMALDLASKSDLAAYVKIFPEIRDGRLHYTAFGKYYLPEETVHDDATRNKKYPGWDNAGLLTVTPGAETDFRYIQEDVEQDLRKYQVLECVYDPYRAVMLAHDLADVGVTMVEYSNTVKLMSEPMKELESAVKSKRWHHDGNPILTWMAGNMTAREDAKGNVFPRKEGERYMNKIDGMTASIMAIGRLMHREDIGEVDEFIENMIAV